MIHHESRHWAGSGPGSGKRGTTQNVFYAL